MMISEKISLSAQKHNNTDTVNFFGAWSNVADSRDFYYTYEALYQKKSGHFFLHACGGPLSKYCDCPCEGIITPYTAKEAAD